MAQQRTRAQQRQRQRMVAIIILLLVIIAAAFYFLSGDKQTKKVRNHVAPKGLVKIPTLKKNIRPGTRISQKMIRYIYRRPREVPTDAILAPDQFIGRFTSHPILAGQYIREGYVGADGAVGGYSAMARPGKRLVVLATRLFPRSIHTLKVGDRIDLLALEKTKVSGTGATKANYNSGAIDGNQPGTRGGSRRRPSSGKSGGGATLRDPGTVSATLIAENAEVMSVPRTNSRGRNISGHTALVLQMEPEDAHVTMLMAAARNTMRAVFRPYGDDRRLTQPRPLKVTTRLPKPRPDPDVVSVIINGKTYLRKPNSTMFRTEEDLDQPEDQPRMIYGRQVIKENDELNEQVSEPEEQANESTS